MRTIGEHGSLVDSDDPGEPSTGQARISITPREARLLMELARGRSVVEIGTGLGVSTVAMAATAARLVTIDIDPWVHEHVWPLLPPSVIRAVRRDHLGPAGLVFIDGDHRPEAFLADIAYAESICPEGLIAAHDARQLSEWLDASWFWVETEWGMAVKVTG